MLNVLRSAKSALTRRQVERRSGDQTDVEVPTPIQVQGANGFALASWQIMLAALVVSWALIISHRPDALITPQFYGEDGSVWYAQAYNLGPWHALFVPEAGYFVTVARLAALISMLFPLSYAPLVFNILGILIQALPVVFLFSRRFDAIMPNFLLKVLLAFLYLALPNTAELTATITNAQWHLALLAFMVIVAEPSSHWWGRTFDVVVLALAGLSGPYCIVLFPVIAIRWWQTRSPWTRALLAVDGGTALVQGIAIVTGAGSSRVQTGLDASIPALARILAGQVFVAGTVGKFGYARLLMHQLWQTWWSNGGLPGLIAIIGVAAMVYAARKGTVELRLLLLYSFLLFCAALIAPDVSATDPQWPVMSLPGAGARYEFIPLIAWMAVLVWLLLQQRQRWLQGVAASILALTLLVGVPLDWQQKPLPDLHFSTYVTQFEQAGPGTRVVIPVNPSPWIMVLVKHP